MLKILSVFGTRPEAIKMAPVVGELAGRPEAFRSRVCVTAQHRQMLDQVLDLFGIVPDLMDDQQAYGEMSRAHNPYGDGKVAERIAEALQAGLCRENM